MPKRKNSQRRHRKTAGGVSTAAVMRAWLRPVCLAAATALVVATPLVSSERAELTGAALPLVMMWLLLALVWFGGSAALAPPTKNRNSRGLTGPGEIDTDASRSQSVETPSPNLSQRERDEAPSPHFCQDGSGFLRFGPLDAVVLALIAWHAVSGLMMMEAGSPRETINAVWTWVGYGAAFIVLRQLISDPAVARTLCHVMIALAVCLSVMGAYQALVSLPAARAAYRENPEATLQQVGIVAPPGSVARRQFEARLGSGEPTATFSLTNSLAGYLAPWLVLLLALGLSGGASEFSWPKLLATLALAAIIAVCLVLTKSRTAWLATFMGVVLLGIYRSRLRNWLLRLLAVAAVAALFGVGVIATGMLDREILSAAPKSLLFRFEYWQSTAAMIADHPLWGCGPGNFQEYYTAYKLPQASESISDPHNFLLEVGATAGTPALLALLAVIALFYWQLPTPHAPRPTPLAPIYLGAAIGVFLSIPLGLVAQMPPELVPLLLGAVVAGGALWMLGRWVAADTAIAGPCAIALAVLLVNLLAAGGIGFPGVAISLWVLCAAGTADSRRGIGLPRHTLITSAGAAVASALLLLSCYFTAYRPVLDSNRFLALSAMERSQENLPAAVSLAEAAAAADPWAAQPHFALAQMHFAMWAAQAEADKNDQHMLQLAAHVRSGLDRKRQSSAALTAMGYLYLQAYWLDGNREHLQEGIALLKQAVDRYPADATAHAQLAWAYHEWGRAKQAAAEAAEALRLDELCPHTERKLAARHLFGEFMSQPSIPVPPQLRSHSAEQLMQQLRNADIRSANR